MDHLISSFQKHTGLRGVHVYSNEECRFLSWDEVISFLNNLPKDIDSEFSEKLISTMSNYNPEREFLAVYQLDDTVSIKLYSKQD